MPCLLRKLKGGHLCKARGCCKEAAPPYPRLQFTTPLHIAVCRGTHVHVVATVQ